MEKKNIGKKIAIIIAAVIAVAGISVGVMAACGVFVSDKAKAFELLEQMPERMGYSAINDYIGMEELVKAQQEKGMTYGLEITNLKFPESFDTEEIDLSGYSMAVNSQTDAAQSKTNATISLEKNDVPLSINYYVDQDKTILAAPELIKGKSFQIGKDIMPENVSDLDTRVVQDFEKDLTDFMEKEVEKIKDEIDCEKLEEKDGYKMLVSKDAMNLVIDDFVAFMSNQQKMVDFINAYVDTMRQSEAVEGAVEPFDFMSSLKTFAEDSKKQTQDFSFHVYGKDGVLVGLETPVNMEQLSATVMIEFAGVEEDSTVTVDVSSTYRGYKATASLVKKSVKADDYSVQILLDITAVGNPVASLTLVETIKPSNNSYSVTGNMTAMGESIADLTINGSIKDLQKGKSVNYVLDDVSLNVAGEDLLSMSMNMQLGVLEGNVEPPQGEVVEYTDSTSIEPYSEEILTNVMGLASSWDMEDAFSALLLGESYEEPVEVEA